MDDEGRPGDARVLVAVATKYGSTLEIARRIGDVLRERAVDADVTKVEDVHGLTPYGAVVLGSAVYAGGWLKSATKFAVSHEAALAERQVWLFSSGLLGELPKQDDPRQVPDIYAAIDASDHRMFAGKLDRTDVSVFDRLLIRLMRASYGDFRMWDVVEAWANLIADDLDATP